MSVVLAVPQNLENSYGQTEIYQFQLIGLLISIDSASSIFKEKRSSKLLNILQALRRPIHTFEKLWNKLKPA